MILFSPAGAGRRGCVCTGRSSSRERDRHDARSRGDFHLLFPARRSRRVSASMIFEGNER